MRIIKQDLKLYNYIDKTWSIRWHKNNMRHREDGPARTWNDIDEYEYYFLEGSVYTKNDYWKKIYENY